MGFVDRIKNLFLKKAIPDTKEYQEYISCKELNQTDINRFKRYIEQYTAMAEINKAEDSRVYMNALEEVGRYTYSLFEAEKTTKFIRPNTLEDIEYRDKQLNGFVDKLKGLFPRDLDIRFHGTPVYFAEEILKSGKISSSADRFDGYIKSTDNSGEISVSDINSLSRTVNYFLDMHAYQRCLPCGCLFVLKADGQTAEQRERSVMNNVDFKKEPERLYAIVTTPENVEKVKEWLSESHMSIDLVHTFDEFIIEMDKKCEKALDICEKAPLEEKMAAAEVICNCCAPVKRQEQEFVR